MFFSDLWGRPRPRPFIVPLLVQLHVEYVTDSSADVQADQDENEFEVPASWLDDVRGDVGRDPKLAARLLGARARADGTPRTNCRLRSPAYAAEWQAGWDWMDDNPEQASEDDDTILAMMSTDEAAD